MPPDWACGQSSSNPSSWGTVATWDGVAQPSAPTTATASPNVSSVCTGTMLTLAGAASGGNSGLGCTIEYQYSDDGGMTWTGPSGSKSSCVDCSDVAAKNTDVRMA